MFSHDEICRAVVGIRFERGQRRGDVCVELLLTFLCGGRHGGDLANQVSIARLTRRRSGQRGQARGARGVVRPAARGADASAAAARGR